MSHPASLRTYDKPFDDPEFVQGEFDEDDVDTYDIDVKQGGYDNVMKDLG